MKGRKREIKIYQEKFVDWYFEEEERADYGQQIIDDFKLYGKFC